MLYAFLFLLLSIVASSHAVNNESQSVVREFLPWHTKTYQLLTEEQAEKRKEVIKSKNIQSLQELFNSGIEIDAIDEDGLTALHEVAWQGGVLVADFLLKKGANINVQDFDDKTPLHRAVQSRKFEMTRFLIARGARRDLKDRYSRTPFFEAFDDGDALINPYFFKIAKMKTQEFEEHKKEVLKELVGDNSL